MALTGGTFGQGTGAIFVDNTACAGSEARLLACNYDTDTSDCSHAEDAGIRCSTGPCMSVILIILQGALIKNTLKYL